MKYREDGKNFFISLDKGEYINKSLMKFAKDKKISSAWINGIGALEKVRVAYFDINLKSYLDKKFDNEYELLNYSGNVTISNKCTFIHSHITFSDRQFRVYGGHLYDAKISGAGEFFLTPGNQSIKRKFNNNIGLNLWDL